MTIEQEQNAALEKIGREYDGTSQADRQLSALDPDYVAIDEHSTKELLAFARKYAHGLRYYTVKDGNVEADGDWQDFIGDDINLDDVIAFLENTQQLSEEKRNQFARPHFALFLTFLKLLEQTRSYLNTLTRQHLDFYYHRVLRMVKKVGIPDQVHVIVDIAPSTKAYELLEGTLLDAGVDSLGQDLVYRSNQRIVVTHAQIERLSSLYVEQNIIGIREAHKLAANKGETQKALMDMLKIVYGVPQIGEDFPPIEGFSEINHETLSKLKHFVDFVNVDVTTDAQNNPKVSGLYMDYYDFVALIEQKQKLLSDKTEQDWARINALLDKAGKNRRSGFQLNITDPHDFDSNLLQAVGGALNFDGVTDVETIYDLYNQPTSRDSVRDAIRNRLYFENIEDFQEMMRLKLSIDRAWEEINKILEAAGRKKNNSQNFVFPSTNPQSENYDPRFKPMDFDANLKRAIGTPTYPSFGNIKIKTIDQFYERLRYLESYFFLSPPDFQYVIGKAEQSIIEGAKSLSLSIVSSQEWDKVYDLLANTYRKKIYAQRLIELKQIREELGFPEMIRFAAGDSQSQLNTFDRLLESVSNSEDKSFLRLIKNTVTSSEAPNLRDETKEAGVKDADWMRVYDIVERALRSILSDPIPEKNEWLNLHPAEDASQVKVVVGLADEADTPRWETFGRAQPISDKEALTPDFGWALTSPMLFLSSGTRTINLILGFDAKQYDADAINAALAEHPFLVQMSTEKAWIEPDSLEIKAFNYTSLPRIKEAGSDKLAALQFTLTFNEDADALAPMSADIAGISSDNPVLRVMMRQIYSVEDKKYLTKYTPFRPLRLERSYLKVKVTGLVPSHIQNDESILNASKPFEPFGRSPASGSRFYIGHEELLNKHLDNLDFIIDWMGVPDSNLTTYYANYPTNIANKDLTSQINLIDHHKQLLASSSALLLNNSDAKAKNKISLASLPISPRSLHSPYGYELSDSDNLLTWSRYFQWELNSPDFQHAIYPGLATQKSVDLAQAIANKVANVDLSTFKIKPPYTPKIKSLTIDYSASLEIQVGHSIPYAPIDMAYHVHPFGYREMLPAKNTETIYFLPQYDNQGELYIGIKNVNPPQNLAILFQMAAGSANPDLEPMPIHWSYLSGNQWVSLDDGLVLRDTTRGLLNPGIIEFSLKPCKSNTLLSSNLYWIRASIANHSDSVCDVIAIIAQAVSATFVNQENAPDHLSRPLAINSISDLVRPLSQIVAIRQPYTSFGGKMPEADAHFYTRISERLRHKQRAVTQWDYEHLILEHFPEIYKVKCLPAQPNKPGIVEIVVIPDIRNKLPFNPFEPKVSADLLGEIKDYIVDYVPPYAQIRVKNARYISVKVRFAVRFLAGYNEGYYKQRLNDDLNRFLAPWAYDEGADIVIGGKIHTSVIINLIEEQDYVDYVAQVKLFTSDDGINFYWENRDWVETTQADDVLVAALLHEIDIISEVGYEAENFAGINYMKIELDFIVE